MMSLPSRLIVLTSLALLVGNNLTLQAQTVINKEAGSTASVGWINWAELSMPHERRASVVHVSASIYSKEKGLAKLNVLGRTKGDASLGHAAAFPLPLFGESFGWDGEIIPLNEDVELKLENSTLDHVTLKPPQRLKLSWDKQQPMSMWPDWPQRVKVIKPWYVVRFKRENNTNKTYEIRTKIVWDDGVIERQSHQKLSKTQKKNKGKMALCRRHSTGYNTVSVFPRTASGRVVVQLWDGKKHLPEYDIVSEEFSFE